MKLTTLIKKKKAIGILLILLLGIFLFDKGIIGLSYSLHETFYIENEAGVLVNGNPHQYTVSVGRLPMSVPSSDSACTDIQPYSSVYNIVGGIPIIIESVGTRYDNTCAGPGGTDFWGLNQTWTIKDISNVTPKILGTFQTKTHAQSKWLTEYITESWFTFSIINKNGTNIDIQMLYPPTTEKIQSKNYAIGLADSPQPPYFRVGIGAPVISLPPPTIPPPITSPPTIPSPTMPPQLSFFDTIIYYLNKILGWFGFEVTK